MRPANERHYNVSLSLISWAHGDSGRSGHYHNITKMIPGFIFILEFLNCMNMIKTILPSTDEQGEKIFERLQKWQKVESG